MSNNTSDFIKQFLNEKVSTAQVEKDFFKEQIIILDNAKENYTKAIYKVDATYFPDIENVNNKILDVKTAYDGRINAGCSTDLFWQFTGITTADGATPGSVITYENYKCVQASPNGIGLTAYLTPSGIANTTNSLLGLEPDNLYGIRVYDEPYSQDVVNSSVGSFIGTIGLGSTILTVMAPRLTSQISDDLKVGQLIVASDDGVFPGLNNEIIGIGTTTANLSGVDSGFSTTSSTTVDRLILKYSSSKQVKAPQDDATYVTFTVLKDPDELQNVGLPFASSPYVPQTIKMMTTSTIGIGVSIELDNASGYPNVSQSWNQFMEGFQDPDYIDDPNKVITKPKVGQGKVYYRTGFTFKPQINTVLIGSPSWVDAKPGDTAQNIVSGSFNNDGARAINLSSCSSAVTNALNNSINVRDTAENALIASTSEVNQKITLSNLIREELNEINARIWAYRTQMGQASSNITTYNGRLLDLNNNIYKDLIDQ